MSAALAPRALDRVVPALAGAAVVAFAAGSSSVGAVKDVGTDGRWVALFALLVAAAAWARGARLPPAAPLAAAAFLAALALVSASWSVDPRLSLGRGASLVVLLAAAALIAAGTRGAGQRVLLGLLWGAIAVALLGVVVLAAAYDSAVVAASIEAPPRFRGFGENPNTVPLLLSLAVPLALHEALRGRRLLGVASLVLFGATIVGAGSRGALLAAATGAAMTLGLTFRGRRLVAALAALVALLVGAAALQSLPQQSSTPAATAATQPASPTDVERAYPLDSDVGRPLPGGGEPEVDRSLFGGSGRLEAWRGAVETAAERPLLGYGFGTEGEAFVDRYYGFVGDLPENSYLGIALQLGALGLALLLGLVAVLLRSGRRALAGPGWGPACAGVVAAGLAAAVVQSYLYSVGNIAAATFWIAAFLLPALGREVR